MKKVYIDLAIAVVCIFLILKHTVLFLVTAGIIVAVCFFVFDDKKEIKDKMAQFYR
ncbi:MAG: hypothetical protein IJ220_06415 [Clostridia bacterium]|nr:hypothetical protein [Clostridia bacterium]